jgi:hypothetical protein
MTADSGWHDGIDLEPKASHGKSRSRASSKIDAILYLVQPNLVAIFAVRRLLELVCYDHTHGKLHPMSAKIGALTKI